MRLVLFSSTSFGKKVMDLMLQTPEVELAGVVTTREIFSISYRPTGVKISRHFDFTKVCQELGVPSYTLGGSMGDPALLHVIRNWSPTAALAAGWYHMIPRSIRDIAPCFGLHASLLPKYSGGAPLVWALINGENETGVTLFKMDEGVDSGPIVEQSRITLGARETIASLTDKAENAAVEILKRNLQFLGHPNLGLHPQDESSRTVVPQRSPEDGLIDWALPSTFIDRFVRAQTKPYPGAFSVLGNQKITIWATDLQEDDSSVDLRPGRLSCVNGKILVGTGTGILRLVEWQIEGPAALAPNLENLVRTGVDQFLAIPKS